MVHVQNVKRKVLYESQLRNQVTSLQSELRQAQESLKKSLAQADSAFLEAKRRDIVAEELRAKRAAEARALLKKADVLG